MAQQNEANKEDRDESQKEVEIGAKCRGPGPAKYLLPGTIGVKGHDIRKHRCPAFSFGQRHKEFSSSISPGPKYMFTAYVTRNGREAAPAFSLYSRTTDKVNLYTPGPGNREKPFDNYYFWYKGSRVLRFCCHKQTNWGSCVKVKDEKYFCRKWLFEKRRWHVFWRTLRRFLQQKLFRFERTTIDYEWRKVKSFFEQVNPAEY